MHNVLSENLATYKTRNMQCIVIILIVQKRSKYSEDYCYVNKIKSSHQSQHY